MTLVGWEFRRRSGWVCILFRSFQDENCRKSASFPSRPSGLSMLPSTDCFIPLSPQTAALTTVISNQETQKHRGGSFIWTLPNFHLVLPTHVHTENWQDFRLPHISSTLIQITFQQDGWPPKIRLKNDNFNWNLIFPIQYRASLMRNDFLLWEFSEHYNKQNVWGFPLLIVLAVCNMRIALVWPLIIHIFQHPQKCLPLNE